MRDPVDVPPNLRAAAAQDGRSGWLLTLLDAVALVERAWSVRVGQPFRPGGQTAWVAPVTHADHDLVVKIAWRHPEGAHEADGLRVWDGAGTVRLHAVEEIDSDTVALLLERCQPGATLEALPEPDQDVVIAGLLRRLWRQPPATGPFRSLQSLCDLWAAQFEAKAARSNGLDRGLARDGIALFRALPSTATRETLLCTDLHAGNVLSAERAPWLVIDPKPYRGDPTYDALQHMLNCGARLVAHPHELVRRMADLLDLDADRLGLWVFARCVQESPDWPILAEVARTIARDTGRRPSSGKSQGELVGLLQVTTAEEHGVHEHRKQLPEADAPPPADGQRRELLVGRESPGRCVSE
jgi:streptomycin 6-kinase